MSEQTGRTSSFALAVLLGETIDRTQKLRSIKADKQSVAIGHLHRTHRGKRRSMHVSAATQLMTEMRLH
jgi:hypothetical protein